DLNAVAGVLTVGGSTGTTLTTNSGTDTSFGVTSVGSSLTSTAGGGVAQTGSSTGSTTSSLTAGGNINLGLLTNDFVGAVTASGANITLRHASATRVPYTTLFRSDLNAVAGVLTVGGSTGTTLTTNSGTDTSFGVTSVGSSLTSTAGGGVGQTGAITVGTTSSLTAGGNINLGLRTEDHTAALTASDE